MRQADAWLKSSDGDLKAHARSLMDAARSPFTQEDVEEEARQIGEMIEVVAWYHTFIPPKMSRAVGGLLERDGADGPAADILRESRLHDANGSGKVTLVAIERSIAAWLRLRDVLPTNESAILNMLAMLDRMRRGIRAGMTSKDNVASARECVESRGTSQIHVSVCALRGMLRTALRLRLRGDASPYLLMSTVRRGRKVGRAVPGEPVCTGRCMGPQTVTRRVQAAVMVVAVEQFRQLTRRKGQEDLATFFRQSPLTEPDPDWLLRSRDAADMTEAGALVLNP